MFMAALLLGGLGEIPVGGSQDVNKKLKRFRLDYILINPVSPFYENVQKSLGGHILEVFRDPTSVDLESCDVLGVR